MGSGGHDDERMRAYLDRIGVTEPVARDAESLVRLHEAHLRTVPFENLSIHLGEPIVLEEGSLVAKIVDRHRGGYCYELNGALGWLLERLGFDVARLSAQVWTDDGL
ncbi:MAG: arylamine N-acetyltransferase, partial [Actinomycetia bacterium]|nr:arylamine N-acetyltransferase [Actinomycetes bacterium]